GLVIAVIIVGTVLLFGVLTEVSSLDVSNVWVVYFGLLSLFICDLVASMWTGMWTACFSRTAAAAPGQAVLRLLLLPWMIFMAIVTVSSIFRLGNSLEPIEVFCGWWALCMTNNVYWIVHSRGKFYRELRASA